MRWWLALACVVGCARHPSAGAPALAAPPMLDFANPMRVTINGYSDHAMEPFISRDGRYLFFNNSNDPSVDTNLHYAERIDDLTFQYQGPIGGVNTSALEAVASEADDGSFYFISNRSYATTMATIYRGTFSAGTVSNVELVPGVAASLAGHVIFDAVVSADGGTLAYADGLFTAMGGPETADIVLADSSGSGFLPAATSATTMQAVNLAGGVQYAPVFSASKLELYFTRIVGTQPTIFGATRARSDAPFSEPQPVAAITGFAEAPTLSVDEKSLYYHLLDGALFTIYRVTRP